MNEEESLNIVWKSFKIPKRYCTEYEVIGTRIIKHSGLLPEPGENIYPTYNAAKRAVARYRKEDANYQYSHPGSQGKNIKKFIRHAFDKAFESVFIPRGSKTVKIRKIKMPGLPDYKIKQN